MTDSNSTNNNSFIPILLLLVSAIVIIATFYEDETKEGLIATDNSQTESVAKSDQHSSNQTASIQKDTTKKDASNDTVSENSTTENDTAQASSTANAQEIKATANAENQQTEEATIDATNTADLNASKIDVAHADSAIITEGNGNNSANGSAGHDIATIKTDNTDPSNEESAVANSPVRTEAAVSEQQETSLNIAQNTAATHQNSARRMPIANAANRYAQRYTPGYMPGPGYQNMMAQPSKSHNAPRPSPAHSQMNMAQHKEASMAYQAKMEQRRQAMMKAMQAQRLKHNARIQEQLKNQAKFLAEMKQMQKIAFQRAEESRRQTMQKIQEINQHYRHLQHQVNKLNAAPKKAPTANDAETRLIQ